MVDPIRAPVRLTPAELQQLAFIRNEIVAGRQQWHHAYQYINSRIGHRADIDRNTRFWFQQAANINQNNGAAAEFIRTYTLNGLTIAGRPASDMQAVSNDIARRVINDVLTSGAIPDLSLILRNDLIGAFEAGGIANLGGWGGSFYYWDIAVVDEFGNPRRNASGQIISLGDSILADPAARNLLIQTLGRTLADFSTIENVGLLFQGSFYDAFSRILSLPADVQDAAFAIARERSHLFTAVWRALLGPTPEDVEAGAARIWPMSYGSNASDFYPLSREEAIAKMAQYFEWLREAARADVDHIERIEGYGAIGAQLGSSIGALIGNNVFEDIAASALLSALGRNIEQAIRNGGAIYEGVVLSHNVFDDFFADFGQGVIAGGVGAISSFLTAELMDELGLEGTLGELANSVTSSALSAIIQNIPAIVQGTTNIAEVLQGINAVNLIGSFIGSKLAASLVQFDTIGGQIGASLGTAVGATAGAKIGAKYGSLWGPVGALIGAFVGYIFGGLIGSLFGGTPRSGASLAWDSAERRFEVAHAWSKHGAKKEAVRSIAGTVAEILNGVLEATGSVLASARAVRLGVYETKGKDLRYRATGGTGAGEITFTTRDASALINHGAAIGVADLLPQLIGGDVFTKRAVAATLALAGTNPSSNHSGAAGSFDINTLLGNMTTARDYALYAGSPGIFNAMIAAEPESAFAAGWSITLARAFELGLHRRGASDWTGGWAAYLDEKAGGVIDGIAFSPSHLGFSLDAVTGERTFRFADGNGVPVGELGDTIDTTGKDRIVGSTSADSIIVSGARITNLAGLSINGQSPTGAEHVIRIAATIDGAAGNDTIVGGDLGNDLLGGEGHDTLVGGKLDDWLLGGAGNDRLFAGAANHQFVDGDAAATAAALDLISNGDMLDGGEGDDVLYGSRGSDWLRGGAGADTLHGGDGGDIIEGGAGNDRGPNGEVRLFGGGGTDQYVFGYGDGIDVIFDDSDAAAAPGSSGDSLYNRLRAIELGAQRNWAGGGEYEIDGSVRGGEDAIAFGAGIGFDDILLQRSGTEAAPGQDLIIRLTAIDPATGQRALTGDELIIKDWFETTRRVEWLRFADGQDIRIGDITSFIVGTAGSDVILGTHGADFIVGGAGNDTIRGLNGDDFGFGGLGRDLVAGDEDNDLVSGGEDDDIVIGALGNDTVFGDGGDDKVYGGAGSDIVVGGRGNDEVIGGAGDDIFRYQRGDGSDVIFDDLVNNWDLVWQGGSYVNGYVLDQATGAVAKDGAVVFDGSQWLGLYDYADAAQTLHRHLGAVGGALAADAGTDYLEFGIGIDIQDLMLSRAGNDLQIAIGNADSDARAFGAISDRITIRDWYLTGNAIENFVFAATGRHDVSSWSITGAGSEGADTIAGTTGVDWITGNGGDDVITGDAGDDVLSGNGGADVIRGGAGADIIYGGAGDDVLEGNAGADQLIGGAGTDIASYATSASAMRAFLNAPHTNSRDGIGDVYLSIEGLEGTAGADRLGGNAGGNVLRGLAGNDLLYGGAGDDIYEIDGSHGQDTIIDAPFVTDEIVTAAGVLDTALYAARWSYLGWLETASGYRQCYRLIVTSNATGEEVYRSRDLIDFIYSSGASRPMPAASSWPAVNGQWRNGAMRSGSGSQAVREIFSNENGGVDTLDFGQNLSLSDLMFERINGGADLRITYSGTHFVTIVGQSDPNRAIEALQLRDGLSVDLTRLVLLGESASAAGDFLVGDANANTLAGLAGDDVLSGAAGDDVLEGNEGDDTLEGGAGADRLDGGTDSITAGLAPSSTEQTRAYGDTIRYVRSNAAVNIDLAAGTASGGHAAGDTLVSVAGVSTIENLVGSEGYGDTLRGDSRANRLLGLGGNDLLEGRGGADVLIGGFGNDTLRGGDGEDNLAGEEGDDTLEGGNDKDLLAGGAGNDSLFGDAGEDVLSGGEGNDVLRGGSENDRLGGDAGADQLYGDSGADQLAGGDGNDMLFGGDGNDVLAGEAGDDQLFGELGDDTYLFDVNSGADVIADASGENRIVIGEVGARQVWLTRSGNDLRIAVIGGTTNITLRDYYSTASPTRVREVMLAERSLFLSHAQPLIDAMTAWTNANGGSIPSQLPAPISDLLGTYWHAAGHAAPVVADQTLYTDEDTPLSGAVGATDHDGNIVSYAIDANPSRGSVSIDALTGAWTYTPGADLHGQDTFRVLVTDASSNRAVQTITVNVASVNDAPSDIALEGTLAIEERDRPPAGTILNAITLGTLSATDVDHPDAGDFASHVFSVADPRFEIVDGTTLRLRAGAALDFESTPAISVAITVTDRNGAGLSFTRNFTFTVLDRDDYFYGTAGDDTLTGQAGRNLMFGYAGNDTLTGADVSDDIDGGDGADQLFGRGGNDLLLGGLGDDVLDGGLGADTLRGGDGVDTLRGQEGADQLFGDDGNDLLQGGAGDDQLDGGAHDDRLEGGEGADRLVGGAGDDLLIGGAGADRFLGGAGFDTVSYESASTGVTVNVTTTAGSAGDAAGDVFEDAPERLIGSAFADVITGSSANEILEGGAGNDVIYGGAGNDTLLGGDGDDLLDAQSGNDILNGGAGNDILIGGDDSDTYLLDANSGADEIRNFDPNGTDIDVVGYQDITREQLWFERSGDDLVVSVIGTSVRTTIRDWYVVTSAEDRSSYKIDFFLATGHVTQTIDAEALVTLMAGYARPATQAQFDALRGNASFYDQWALAWNLNAPPSVPAIAAQSINEDGTLTLTLNISDDFTPAGGLTVAVQAVRPDNHAVEDLSVVNAPTVSAPNAAGERTLTVTTRPNASGQVAIRVRAVDAGGLATERVFLLTVAPVADAPLVTLAQVATPLAPLTQPTLDSGTWGINLQAALVDQDGSETLEVRIANVPGGITFNAGTNLGGGVWSFTPAQLPGLRILGPADWSQDLALSITAVSREIATGQTASSAPVALDVVINARPTDLWADRTLAFNENTPQGTGLAWFGRTDGDSGDTATYELLDNAGGRFTLRSDGLLSAGSTLLDYESSGSHTITVRVTDSGGLSRTEDFLVNVNNVNEAPTSISADRTLGFNENVGSGTGLAWFTASDPEGNVTSYSLVSNAGGRFSMGSNGLLSTGSTPLNYEAATGHWITVRATDAGGLYRDQSFWVDVYNVNESPWINPASFTVYEGSNGGPGNVLITTGGAQALLSGGDPEGVALRYQLVGGDTGMFSIDSNGYLRQHGVLDYESRQSYSVTVRAWDGGAIGAGNYVDSTVPIAVANVNEGPKITQLQYHIMVSPPVNFKRVGFVATDPEGNAVTSASIVSWWHNNGATGIGPGAPILGDYYGTPQIDTGYISWKHQVMDQTLVIRLTDSLGAQQDTTIRVWTHEFQIIGPVVLDLDGDGVNLRSLYQSDVQFDMTSDGDFELTGWTSGGDALLALDRNGDGLITHGAEISFMQDTPGANSDLEGLTSYDTDGDGYFDKDDAAFGEFLVWQDANSDGVSQAGELRTLAEHGIDAISLTRTLTGAAADGATDNVITATSQFIRRDGTVGTVGDVMLAHESPTLNIEIIDSVPVRGRYRDRMGGEWAEELESEPGLAIDGIDRRSDAPMPASLLPGGSRMQQADSDLPRPGARKGGVADDASEQGSLAADERAAASREPARARSPELPGTLAQVARMSDEYWPTHAPNYDARGALHTGLELVTRRRLQMIEAMASFSAEGAADLSLEPQRRLDARTLELLTSTPTVRIA